MSEFESSFKSDRDSAMNIRMFKHHVLVRVRTVKKRINFSDIFAIKLASSSILSVRRWPYFVQDIFCLVWLMIEIQKGASIYICMVKVIYKVFNIHEVNLNHVSNRIFLSNYRSFWIEVHKRSMKQFVRSVEVWLITGWLFEKCSHPRCNTSSEFRVT